MSTTTDTKEKEYEPEEMGEFTVSDELYEIAEATNSDGTVDVSIYDFEKIGSDEVRVHFTTPTMDKQSETMDWPSKDSPDYKFVRLCRKTVGSLSGAKWLKTDGAEIKADPESWEIEADLSKGDEIKESVKTTSIKDIGAYGGIGLLAIWAVGITTILVGGPIIGAATLLGIVGVVAGLWKLWVAAFIGLIITLIILPE